MSQHLGQMMQRGQKLLASAGIKGGELDARLLLQHVTGLGHSQIIADPDQTISDNNDSEYQMLLARRRAFEPVSRIIGRREFWSLEFEITPAVLDPRPDSETLVSAVLDDLDDRTVPLQLLDLGTGSGCLTLALLHELPGATAIAVDSSRAALTVAGRNAKNMGHEARVDFICGDWTEGLPEAAFDIIVCNPPYVEHDAIAGLEPDVRLFDPTEALDGGADGLSAYRSILADIRRLMKKGGRCYFEVGAGQAENVKNLMLNAGLACRSARQDIAGIDRCVAAQNR